MMKKYLIKLCLCIFGGPLGLHYWYTKKYGKAILFLLTAGGFGIWYIYDVFKIITDKNYLSENIINSKNIKSTNTIQSKDIFVNTVSKPEIKAKKEVNVGFERKVSDNKKISEEVNDSLNTNLINNVDLYLKAFNNLQKYDMNQKLDDAFLTKIKRVKEVEYEKFVKPSGTTDRPMDFVVFDLETTGLSATSSEILEIGAVRFETNKPVEVFHTFIKPKKKISAKITSINGISNEMVENCPTIEEVIPKFIDFIGEDVLVAHNSNFDMGFILNQLYSQGYKKIKNKAIDTLKLSRQKIREYDSESDTNKKLSSYKLENLKNEFGLWEVGSHNAIDDCKVCAFVYMKIKNEYGDFCYIY